MAGTVRKRSWVTRKGAEKSAWVAYYFDQKRKRHNKSFPTKRAAEAWLLQARSEVRDGTHTPEKGSLTVAQAADRWLDRAANVAKVESATLSNYRRVIRLHITPLIGEMKLAHLTTPRINEYLEELLRTRSRANAQHALHHLKMILGYMQVRGELAHDVAGKVRVSAEERDRVPLAIGRDVPSKEEIRRLLETAAPRSRPWLLTAALTGLRASELRGLAWECVDFEKGTIEVKQRAAPDGVTLGPPKTGASYRKIPMSEELIACLREWRMACPRIGSPGFSRMALARRLAPVVRREPHAIWHMLRRFNNDEAMVIAAYRARDARLGPLPPLPPPEAPGRLWLVFPDRRGGVMRHSTLDAVYWRKLQVKAGVVNDRGMAKYGIHKLRHFFASTMIEQQFEPKRLQELLGHRSIAMTFDRYGHWFEKLDDDRARMSAGARALLGGK
jgi:integrase